MSSPASATVSVLLLPSKDTVVPSRLPPMGTETHCTSNTPMLPGKGRWVRAPHLNQSLKSATPEWYCRVWLDHGSASPGLECPEVSWESSQAWRSHALKADSSSAQSRVALGSHCSQFWDRGSTVAVVCPQPRHAPGTQLSADGSCSISWLCISGPSTSVQKTTAHVVYPAGAHAGSQPAALC